MALGSLTLKSYTEEPNSLTIASDLIAPLPGDLVIVFAGRSRASRTIQGISSTLSLDGEWTRYDVRNDAGTCPEIAIFVGRAASSTAGTVTVSANQSTSFTLAVYTLSGAGDVVQSKAGTASGASAASVTLDSASAAGNLVLGMLVDVDADSQAVAGAGFTQLYADNVGGGNGHRVVVQHTTASVATVPFASLNGVQSALVAIEIEEGEGGGGEPDEEAPTTPQNLSVSGKTHKTVTLSWSASTDNVGVAGYRIYRDNALIDSTSGTTFTDVGLDPETQYEYEVSAYDAADNESARSSAVQVTTLEQPPPGVAIIGDSDSDEYRADDDRGQDPYKEITLNWTEILVNTRGLDLGIWGNWGGPRRTGYEYNWARSGANLNEISGQTSGIAAQIASGLVSHVIINIGINDWKVANGLPPAIYSGAIEGSELDDLIDTHASYIESAVSTLVSAGATGIAICHIADEMALPPLWGSFPNATNRQKVHDALATLNGRFTALEGTYPGVVVAVPFNDYLQDLLLEIDGSGNMVVGGETIEVWVPGWDPYHMQLADSSGHASTISNCLKANFIIEHSLGPWGIVTQPFSETEIIEIATGTWEGPGSEPVEVEVGFSEAEAVGLPVSIDVASVIREASFGEAPVAGFSASIEVTTVVITASAGQAQAVGFAASLHIQSVTVAASFGEATADGFATSIDEGIPPGTVTVSFSEAEAVGFVASLDVSAGTVEASFSEAEATGFETSIMVTPASVAASFGEADAPGFPVTIDVAPVTITAAFSEAQATGFAIQLTEGIPAGTVAASFGEADAPGFPVSIDVTSVAITASSGQAEATGFAASLQVQSVTVAASFHEIPAAGFDSQLIEGIPAGTIVATFGEAEAPGFTSTIVITPVERTASFSTADATGFPVSIVVEPRVVTVSFSEAVATGFSTTIGSGTEVSVGFAVAEAAGFATWIGSGGSIDAGFSEAEAVGFPASIAVTPRVLTVGFAEAVAAGFDAELIAAYVLHAGFAVAEAEGFASMMAPVIAGAVAADAGFTPLLWARPRLRYE